MGISAAISATLSGIRATEAGLEVVSRNIANADTPGYVRKSLLREDVQAGGNSFGVRAAEITREIDNLVQRQIWDANSAAANANILNQFLGRLDGLFGAPGAPNSVDNLFNEFVQSIQELTSSPDSSTVRQNVTGAAQVFAQQLHQLTEGIQLMRSEADFALAGLAREADSLLQQLEQVNNQIIDTQVGGQPLPALLDERDRIVGRLAQLFDVNVTAADNGTVLLTTQSGVVLFDGVAAKISFDARGVVGPATQYDADPAQRGVGTIQIVASAGLALDLLQPNLLRSGEIAAYASLRDDLLVEAQAQLDEMARSLAEAFSTVTTAGAAATVGAQTGFDLDLTGLQTGNSFSVTTTVGGQPQTFTFIRVDDPATLPLANDQTADPNDTVVGIDFSGGFAAAVAQIDAALGGSVTASDNGGNVLRILDDGAVGNSDINAASSRITQTSLTAGTLEFPFFTDKDGVAFTNALDGIDQQIGFAGRIRVNDALVSDPSRLVVHSTAPLTGAGDPARPFFILDALTEGQQTFSSKAGIGTASTPFTGSPADYLKRLMDFQAGQAASAERQHTARATVSETLNEKFLRRSGVNIDEEMAELLKLQNAYAANARIMQAVNEMLQALMRI